MTEFKRKKGESFESFLRKFNKALRSSKRLNEARGRKSLAPKKNKRKQKEYALTSLKLRQKNEYLRKIGKLSEDSRNKKRYK